MGLFFDSPNLLSPTTNITKKEAYTWSPTTTITTTDARQWSDARQVVYSPQMVYNIDSPYSNLTTKKADSVASSTEQTSQPKVTSSPVGASLPTSMLDSVGASSAASSWQNWVVIALVAAGAYLLLTSGKKK